jgi:hypothetical protein
MPARSQAQHRFFEMMKHHPARAKAAGISQAVAEEFTTGSPQGLPEHVADRHPAVIRRHHARRAQRGD